MVTDLFEQGQEGENMDIRHRSFLFLEGFHQSPSPGGNGLPIEPDLVLAQFTEAQVFDLFREFRQNGFFQAAQHKGGYQPVQPFPLAGRAGPVQSV